MVVAGRTRRQIESAVGYNLAGQEFYEGTTTGAGDTTSWIDTQLWGPSGASRVVGRWIVATSGSNDGVIRRSTNFDGTSDMTTTAFANASGSGSTYQLWPQWADPRMVREFVTQAILDAYGAAFDPEEDISLHGDGRQARFDIPTQFAMLQHVEYRYALESTTLHEMERVFDETTDSDFTQVVDQEDYKRGGSSLQITIGAGASAGDFVADSIDSLDISKYTHLEGWVKSNGAVTAGGVAVRLDNGPVQGDGTDLEVLDITPAALVADTWTFFRVALATPELDTAIVSVGLEENTDSGDHVLWFDDFRVTRTANQRDSSIWRELPRHLWYIDRQARDLIFEGVATAVVGYSLIKLRGGDEPALPTTDAAVMEIDDWYVICRATELALMATSGGPNTDPQRRREQVVFWRDEAEKAKRAFPSMTNVRLVD